jgi:pyruvate/oxaloacetate carboxyltransferase
LFAQEITQLEATMSPAQYLKLGLTPTVAINQADKHEKSQQVMKKEKKKKGTTEKVKRVLTTAPPPISSKVDFYKEIEELKGQHEKHEVKKQVNNLEKQHIASQ